MSLKRSRNVCKNLSLIYFSIISEQTKKRQLWLTLFEKRIVKVGVANFFNSFLKCLLIVRNSIKSKNIVNIDKFC
jgi:hypothetical protein